MDTERNIESKEHLADSSAAHGIFNAKKGKAGKTVHHRVGRAHAHIADSFAVAVFGDPDFVVCKGTAHPVIDVFAIVFIKFGTVKNTFVFFDF